MKGLALVCLSLLFSFVSASLGAAASTLPSTCLDSNPRQKEILSGFTWYSKDPGFEVDFCEPKNLGYRVASALLFLKSTGKLNSAQTDPFDRGVLGADPFQFFSSRIHTLEFDPDDEDFGCDDFTAAYVNAAIRNGVMHICRHLGELDELTISSALVHEARHEDSYHQHAVCKHGFMIGQTACDESYSSGDSYSVQTEYMVKVSRATQLDPATRKNARATALEYFANRFNSPPLGIKRGALLLTADSRLVFYDGQSTTLLRSLENPAIKLYQSGDVLKFYDPVHRLLGKSLDGAEIETIETNHDMDLGQSKFVDRYWTQRADCWLYTNRLICDFPERKVDLPIRNFTPIGFQSYSLTDRFEKTVRIVSKDRRVYSVNAYSTELSADPTNYVNTGSWSENSMIGLSFDGKVYLESVTPQSSHNEPHRKLAPGLDTKETYIKMIAPYYWSKDLQNL